MNNEITPFEQIRRTNSAGNEFWSSRDFARVLGYNDYRNFEGVIVKARTACFNSGHRLEDHFVDITEMIGIGKGISSWRILSPIIIDCVYFSVRCADNSTP